MIQPKNATHKSTTGNTYYQRVLKTHLYRPYSLKTGKLMQKYVAFSNPSKQLVELK